MSLLEYWVQLPAAKALGWTLVHSLWEGAAIALALAVAMLAIRNSRARYASVCMAMLAMLACFGLTLARLMPPAATVAATFRMPVMPPVLDGSAGDLATVTKLRAEDLLPWLAPFWIAGVLFFQLRGVAGWMSARRLRRRGVCGAPDPWQARLDRLAARLRVSRPVTLLESCLAEIPVVIGYARPVILMPVGLLTGLPAAQIEAILLHELAHIRRFDYLVNLLQISVEGLLFYHPAVWWISGVMRAERENCCDDLVVATSGDAREYARALAALEENRCDLRQAALAATGGNLMKRIRRLLSQPEGSRAVLTPAISAGVLSIAAAATLMAWQSKPIAQPDQILYESAIGDIQHGRYERARLELETLIRTYDTSEYLAKAKLAMADSWYREGGPHGLAQAVAEYKDFILFYPATAESAEAQANLCRIFSGPMGRAGAPDGVQERARAECGQVVKQFPDSQFAPQAQQVLRNIEARDRAPAPQVAQVQAPAAAQAQTQAQTQGPSGPYRKWLNEDVAYIITDQERAAFKALQTNAEDEKFIEQFWLIRDPTPSTVENEMKEEHYRRIAYANEHYASFVPGWKTDRGRIYIQYGPPNAIESHPSGGAYQRPVEQGGGQTTTFPFEQWLYDHIDGIGYNVIIEFVDPDRNGEYRMTMDPNAKDALHQIPSNVFVSGETGPHVSVEITPERRMLVTIPVGLAAGHYSIDSRTTRLSDGSTFAEHSEVQANGSARLPDAIRGARGNRVLEPGAYQFTVDIKDQAGATLKTYTVSFIVN